MSVLFLKPKKNRENWNFSKQWMLWCSTNGVGPFPNGYSVFITCFPLLHFYCCKHRAVGQLEKPKALELRNVNGFNFMALWIREGDAAMALNWVHTELIFWLAVAGRVLLGWQRAAQGCRQAPSPAGWSNTAAKLKPAQERQNPPLSWHEPKAASPLLPAQVWPCWDWGWA